MSLILIFFKKNIRRTIFLEHSCIQLTTFVGETKKNFHSWRYSRHKYVPSQWSLTEKSTAIVKNLSIGQTLVKKGYSTFKIWRNRRLKWQFMKSWLQFFVMFSMPVTQIHHIKQGNFIYSRFSPSFDFLFWLLDCLWNTFWANYLLLQKKYCWK